MDRQTKEAIKVIETFKPPQYKENKMKVVKVLAGVAAVIGWVVLLSLIFSWTVYAYVYHTTPERDNFMESLAQKATYDIHVGAEVKGLEVKEPHGYEHFRVEHQRDLLEVSNE